MHSDDVVVSRNCLNSKFRKSILSIYGIKVSIQNSYKVIKLLAADLKNDQNNRISIIVQNHQIIILISKLGNGNSIINKTQNKNIINPQIMKNQGVSSLSGYSIYSILHEDFLEILKNTVMTFNKFDQPTFWRPFKFSSLEIDSITFPKMLNSLSNHRFIFSFNPRNGVAVLQITLIITASSNEQLIIKTQDVRNKLSKIKTLHGKLESYQKKELRKSILQILLGINNVDINSSPIIEFFNKLKFPKQTQLPIPKYSTLLQDRFNFRKDTKHNKKDSNHENQTSQINLNSTKHLDYLPQELFREGWIENNEVSQDSFLVYTYPNLLIHFVVIINFDFKDNLKHFLLHGISFIFRVEGKELIYVKSVLKN